MSAKIQDNHFQPSPQGIRGRVASYIALATAVAIAVASIFLALAAYQILPAGTNIISNFGIGGQAIAYTFLAIGVIGTLLCAAFIRCRQMQRKKIEHPSSQATPPGPAHTNPQTSGTPPQPHMPYTLSETPPNVPVPQTTSMQQPQIKPPSTPSLNPIQILHTPQASDSLSQSTVPLIGTSFKPQQEKPLPSSPLAPAPTPKQPPMNFQPSPNPTSSQIPITISVNNHSQLPDLKGPCPEVLWQTANRTKRVFPTENNSDTFATMHAAAKHFLQNLNDIESAMQMSCPDMMDDWNLLVNGGSTEPELAVVDEDGKIITKKVTVQVQGLKAIYNRILKDFDAGTKYNYELFMAPLKVTKKNVDYSVKRQVNYGGALRWETFTEPTQIPDTKGNVFDYQAFSEQLLRCKLKAALYNLEEKAGISANFIKCFEEFRDCVSAKSTSNVDSAKQRVLALSTAMRNYLALRENPHIAGANTGNANHTLELLKAKLFPRTKMPPIKLKHVHLKEGKYLVGVDGSNKEHLVMSCMCMPTSGHYNNIVFNPARSRYCQLDTLPNRNKHVLAENELSGMPETLTDIYCIPWETWKKIDPPLVNDVLDVEKWTIPTNENNNCFFVTALLQCVMYSLWAAYSPG